MMGKRGGPRQTRREFMEKAIDRFWSKVERRGPDDCWLWAGNLLKPNPAGMQYGSFVVATDDGRSYNYRAHRFAWMLANGAIPEGYVIMHTCDVPLCCNPAHLEAGTQAQNVLDQAQKLRTTIGERNRHARLTADDVMAIRESSESDTELAKRYGVWPSTINHARRGIKWKHLPMPETDCSTGGNGNG